MPLERELHQHLAPKSSGKQTLERNTLNLVYHLYSNGAYVSNNTRRQEGERTNPLFLSSTEYIQYVGMKEIVVVVVVVVFVGAGRNIDFVVSGSQK